ncbi:rhodopsin, partial [Lasius niger]
QKETINKRGERRPQFNFYKLKSNMIIATLEKKTPFEDVRRRIGANEEAPSELRNWTETIDGNSVEMMQDFVVKEISAE